MVAIHSTIDQVLLPEVQEFLSQGPKKLFIDGQWVESASGETFKTLNPGSGAELVEVYAGGEEDVNRAVEAADRAFRKSGWATMTPNERGVILHRLADLVEKHLPILNQLEALDDGKVHAQATGDIEAYISTLRYYADMAIKIKREVPIAVSGHEAYSALEPYGVCGFIIPWNFPFLLLGWGTCPALAAGNTIVVKPAEDTPLTTLYICNLVKEAGVPDGVFNVVPGLGETAGKAVSEHPGFRRMSFTGSPEVGRLVAEACGRNLVPVKLELGGKGAAVVFDDTNVEDTAQKLAGAITFHSGQVCCTATRWIVQKKVYDRVVDLTSQHLSQIQIGHELQEGSQMGPVVSAKQRDRVLGYLRDGAAAGAEFILEGGPAEVSGHEDGFFVKPAMLAGTPDNLACTQEIFGPVTYVMPFEEEEEAVQLVNRSRYGLANSVWTKDLERANRMAKAMVAGNSWINAHNVFAQGVPYAGVNLSGMGGGVNSPETYYDYLRPKSIVRPL